mmetsp:Transcript_68529/g.107860  ORF Transcript_68529/g.107860 Transcript_68529/m.107860 type:complete len:273 (-) Transcript_68529:139-957(-)
MVVQDVVHRVAPEDGLFHRRRVGLRGDTLSTHLDVLVTLQHALLLVPSLVLLESFVQQLLVAHAKHVRSVAEGSRTMKEIGRDPGKHVLELLRVEVVGLKEGHTGNAEREHGHLAVLQNCMGVHPVDHTHSIHVFNLPESRRQSLLGVPVIAQIIGHNVVSCVVQDLVQFHIVDGQHRGPTVPQVRDTAALVGACPTLMPYDGQFLRAFVLRWDVPRSQSAPVQCFETDLLKFHAIRQRGSDHLIGDTSKPGAVHDDMGHKFVHTHLISQLL